MDSLPQGWSKQYSKTHKKDYYANLITGKRQWHPPNNYSDLLLEKIYIFFNNNEDLSKKIFNSSRNYINFLKKAIFDEFIQDYITCYEKKFQYSVLDIGSGCGEDLFGLWGPLKASSYLSVDFIEKKNKIFKSRSASLHGTPADKVQHVEYLIADMTNSEGWAKVETEKKKFNKILSSKNVYFEGFDIVYASKSAEYFISDIISMKAFVVGVEKNLSSRGLCVLISPDSEEWEHKDKSSWGPINIQRKEEETTISNNFSENQNHQQCFSPSGSVFSKNSKIGQFNQEPKEAYYLIIKNNDGSTTLVPQWWICSEELQKQCKNVGLKISFQCNLAAFASWLGVQTFRSSLERQFMWKLYHEVSINSKCNGENSVNSEAWAAASFFKLTVLSRENFSETTYVDFLKNNYNLWEKKWK